jgi:RNA polymerase sigma-70 factor (ECF subfamily)
MQVGAEDVKEEDGEPLILTIPDPAPLPEELIEQAEERHQLHDLIQRLPPPQYAVVWLRYAEGLSFQEIASRLRIQAATARTIYYRGRTRLRAALSSTPA